MNIKELVTFLYFVFPDTIIHLPFFFNDPLAISNQLSAGGERSHNTARSEREGRGCVRRDKAEGRRVPLSCRVSLPQRKIPHLSPEEINIGLSASLFSCDEKTRSGTEEPTDSGSKV